MRHVGLARSFVTGVMMIYGTIGLIATLVATVVDRPALAQAAVTVDIKDFSFQPRDVTVNAGMTVRWINMDDWPHLVAAEDGKTFTSPLIQPTKDFTFTFTQPGRFTYRCGVHPTMLGEIVVQGP